MIKVPRLKINRFGVYCLRVYRTNAEGKLCETLHSLGTKSSPVARVLALQFNEAYERKRNMTGKAKFPSLDGIAHKFELDLSRGVMKAEGQADYDLMMQAIKAYKELHGTHPPIQEAMAYGQTAQTFTPPRPMLRSMKFSAAVAAYLEEKKHDNNANTIKEKQRTFNDFQALFSDLEINLFSKPELVQWKTHDLKRGITAQRLNARLGQLNDLFTWTINHGHYTAHPTSPVEGLKISKKSKLASKTEHYEPFTNDDLKAIFDAGYLKKMNKPDFYWLPIVALFTGARREELAALKANDVKTVDGITCFQIQDGKNKGARRVVPIHPQLVKMGFVAYAQHVQSLGEHYLFPYLSESANGRGKNVGRQFALWLDEIGIKESRKVFHSFRHTVITRLHSTGANSVHVMQITGHSDETRGVHFQTYTHDVGLQALAGTLERLAYPLDLAAVQLPDPTFSAFLKRWRMIEDRKKHRAKLAALRKEKTPRAV